MLVSSIKFASPICRPNFQSYKVVTSDDDEYGSIFFRANPIKPGEVEDLANKLKPKKSFWDKIDDFFSGNNSDHREPTEEDIRATEDFWTHITHDS